MKHLLYISLIVLLSGCYTPKKNNPEVMADLASQLKDIATAVDGTLKFSETSYSTTDELLKCDANTALIEDAGCTAQSDIQHWGAGVIHQCEITINAQQLCN